jgi:hypothetical protein
MRIADIVCCIRLFTGGEAMRMTVLCAVIVLVSSCRPQTDVSSARKKPASLLVVDYRDMDNQSVHGITGGEEIEAIRAQLEGTEFNAPGGSCKPELWFFFLDRSWEDDGFTISSRVGICTGAMGERPESVQADFEKLQELVKNSSPVELAPGYIDKVVSESSK